MSEQPGRNSAPSATSLSSLIREMPRRRRREAFVRIETYRRESGTYGDVYDEAMRFKGYLAGGGISKGDRVVLQGPNGPRWVSLLLGCVAHGAVVVPLDENTSASFLAAVCRQAQPRLVVAPARTLTGELGVPTMRWEDVPARLARAAPDDRIVEAAPDDLLEIIFTSGTTGTPRGVLVSHRNILSNLAPIETVWRRWERWARLWGPLRFWSVLPLSHLFGQVTGVWVTLLLGATTIWGASLAPGRMASALAEERVTAVFAVPRVLRLLQEFLHREAARHGPSDAWRKRLEEVAALPPWRRIWAFRRVHRLFGWRCWAFVVGGASVEPELIEFWRRLGYAVMQGYGLTEAGPIVTVNNPFGPSLYSAGRPLPGLEVKLAPDGEILVRGPHVTPGYLNEEELTARTLQDGWLRTGDIGEWDASGHLHIRGRKKDVIVTEEGFNVFPEDVERELRRHPDVKDAVVLGLTGGGRVDLHAVVLTRKRETDLQRVLAETNARLEPHQKIRGITAWEEADFPRTPTQKIRRAAVEAAILRRAPPQAESLEEDRLRALVTRLLHGPDGAVPTDARLEDDLGLSSLDRLELAERLEQEGQVSVPENGVRADATVGDLKKLVQSDPHRESRLPFPRWPRRLPARALRAIVLHGVGFPVLRCFARIRVRGRDRLNGLRPPVLFVANHTSQLDTLAILRALPPAWRGRLAPAMTTRVAEPYLDRQRHGFWAWLGTAAWVQALFLLGNVYFLAGGAAFRTTLRHTGQLVARGYCPLVYPEGAITTDGTLKPFKGGIGMMVREMDIPVVPVAVQGLYDILPPTARFPKRRGCVRVSLGWPLRFAGEPREVIAQRLEAEIRNLLLETGEGASDQSKHANRL